MPQKRIPTPTQDAGNWGTILNEHLAQTQNPLNGAFNSFDQFSARPTNLTIDDTGKTYLYTQTGNWHEWSGTEWKVQNKSEINVKDYGAIGDGVADDTAAIQRAIDYAKLLNFVQVFIPTGKYLINSSVTLYSNIHIHGVGKDSLLIAAASISIFNINGVKVTTGNLENKTSQYLNSIVLDSLGFVSKHVYNDSITLVNFIYCKNSSVKNCFFDGYTYDSNTASVLHLCHFGGFYSCKFANNTFNAPGNSSKNTSCYGFNGLNDGSVASGGYSENNICYDVGDTGMGLWTGAENISSTNDTFYISSPGYTTVGIDCAGVADARITNASFFGGNVAIRIGTNLGYVNKGIEINNIIAKDQSEQSIKIFHENFGCIINGGKISTGILGAIGVYVGMQNDWLGEFQINNTIIESIGSTNYAIFFDLLPAHKLVLYRSNPIIKAGKLIGYPNEFRYLGEYSESNLVFCQLDSVDITSTTLQTFASGNLEAGFYIIKGNYKYTGTQLNLNLNLNTLNVGSQLFGTSSFRKPFIVQQNGITDFKASIVAGGTGSISNFNVYRIL